MYAVCVTFEIHIDRLDAFTRLVLENAASSLATEEGCQQFDVCTDTARPSEIFLYEVYADRGAFDHHLQSAHFRHFNDAAAHMIAFKTVKTYGSVSA